jgi:hypothetical protein
MELLQQAYVVLCGWRKECGLKCRRNVRMNRVIKREIQGTLYLGISQTM